MKAFESWMLGYLLNSLWQVPVIFAAGWLVARMVRRIGPQAEHRVWVGVLLLEVILPACRLHLSVVLRQAWELIRLGWSEGGPDGTVRITFGADATVGGGVLRLPAVMLEGIAVVYGCSLLYFAGRLGWGLWRTHAMLREAEHVTPTGKVARSWKRYRQLFGIDAVELAASARIFGPVTVGFRRGVLLTSPGFLESLDEGDVDAVVAHEFAHMRRHDFAKNLAYGFATLPVTYHPVLWWTRSRIAESREMVCDAMAAEAVAGKDRYARSLLRLASVLADRTPVRSLHAIGIFDANIFERRVMNLTKSSTEVRGLRRIAIAAMCVAVGLATCASALALRMEVAAPAAQTGSTKTMKVPIEKLKILSQTDPIYPASAKADKDTLNGPVVMAVTIGKDGSVKTIAVTKGLRYDYDASAVEAVQEWKWQPYLLNGNPVKIETTVTITYSIEP